MSTQTNNGPYSHFWLTILLAIAILLLLTVRETKSAAAPPTDTYHQIQQLSVDEAIEQLRKRSQRAQQIVPHFPPFPKIWLLPPKEKGNYDSIAERYCLEFMEMLFPGHRFKKVRPDWLRNTLHGTGRCLELDGFCPELRLALEYNGRQHYEWPNFTGMTQEEFIRQQERDQFKAHTCIKNNVCLIRIPYTVPLERIPLAIYAKLLDAVPGL